MSKLSVEESYFVPRTINLKLILRGEPPGPGESAILAVFNNLVLLEDKWMDEAVLSKDVMAYNLKEPYVQDLITDIPLLIVLRRISGKGTKDTSPLINPDNYAGASVDLLPLLIGEDKILTSVRLENLYVDKKTDCFVEILITTSVPSENEETRSLLTMTMMSVHCVPSVKEGTIYTAAIGLDRLFEPMVINFGLSMSSCTAEKTVWASTSILGFASNTAINVPKDDFFVPEDLSVKTAERCRSFYWYSMKRVLVDTDLLIARLATPFYIEVAGVPKIGKVESRGRYMGQIDAGVLLEPKQFSVTISARLYTFNEGGLPENVSPLLDLPPSSAKAQDTDVSDEFGHDTFVVIKFDLCEPLVIKPKFSSLFETIGLSPPQGITHPIYDLDEDQPPDDKQIDVRRIKREGGALAVHKELSALSCGGSVPMNQGIKRTAANHLLMRVRSMFKQFSPGECSYVDWQEVVTSQHAAGRRAVQASFTPPSPPKRFPSRFAAARSRVAGNNVISERLINENLKCCPRNPRYLLQKILRCLESRSDLDAKNYILKGLNVKSRNRYLLWLFGGQEFDKGSESANMAAAAFRIACQGDYSNGTSNSIGWAALHTLYHYKSKPYSAFVAAKRMRKYYQLPIDWKEFLKCWVRSTGEEEIFWIPDVVSSSNSLLITAAFFLCLRCFKFSENVLQCLENGCAVRGSHLKMESDYGPDIVYLRVASLILRRYFDEALNLIEIGIKKFGPSPILNQMRVSCLMCVDGWNGQTERALEIAEKSGAEICPSLLMTSALQGLETNPQVSLQRAARAHKIAPSAHSALIISRVYAKMYQRGLAERWAAVAVKWEPLLADGWAVLALLAMHEKNLDRARALLRTAQQVGVISQALAEEVKIIGDIVNVEELPVALAKKLCLCID